MEKTPRKAQVENTEKDQNTNQSTVGSTPFGRTATPRMRDNRSRNPRPQREEVKSDMTETVVQVNRTSKKTKGGNTMSFSAVVVVGNKKGRVGVGMGKAPEVAEAIRKASAKAKKSMINVPLFESTIPHTIEVKLGAARVWLKPVPAGSGVIAGGAVRAVVEAAGIRDVLSKVLGTNNKASNVYATMEALRQLKARPEPVVETKSSAKATAKATDKAADKTTDKNTTTKKASKPKKEAKTEEAAA